MAHRAFPHIFVAMQARYGFDVRIRRQPYVVPWHLLFTRERLIFDFKASILSTDVYPFLLIFLVFIPIFILAEKKAEDPVISLHYFTNRNILVTMLLSTLS